MASIATINEHAAPGLRTRKTRGRTTDARRVISSAVKDVELAAERLVAAAHEDEDRASFMAWILKALADAKASDVEALIGVLEQPEILAALRQRDPLAPARLRGLHAKRRLLAAEGGVVTGQEFAHLVGVSRQAVDKRRKQGALIGLRRGKRGYAYPIWQADVECVKEVLAELRDYDPWTQASFMLTPNRWLADETPLSTLRRGDLSTVVNAARMYGEQTGA